MFITRANNHAYRPLELQSIITSSNKQHYIESDEDGSDDIIYDEHQVPIIPYNEYSKTRRFHSKYHNIPYNFKNNIFPYKDKKDTYTNQNKSNYIVSGADIYNTVPPITAIYNYIRPIDIFYIISIIIVIILLVSFFIIMLNKNHSTG